MRKKAHKLLFEELFYQTTERRASRESIQKPPSPPPTPTLESDRINDKSFWIVSNTSERRTEMEKEKSSP